MSKSKMFGGSSAAENNSAAENENLPEQSGPLKRLLKRLERTPWWLLATGLVFGFTFTTHNVATEDAKPISNLEAVGTFLVLISLTLTAIRFYRVVRNLTMKSNKLKKGMSRGLSIGGAILLITVLIGMLEPSGAALRWKIDPSAKIRYEASVVQAEKEATIASEKLIAIAARAALEKQQLEEKKKVEEENRKQAEENLKQFEASQKQLEEANSIANDEAAMEASRNMANGGFTQSEIRTLKSFSATLNSYLYSYAGFIEGVKTAAAMEYACSVLQDSYGVLRPIFSDSIYFDDLLDRVKDYSYEAKSTCAHAFKKSRLDEVGESGRLASTAYAFIKRVLSEIN
ncbi:MAG: hypothetical protein Q7R42_04765 [Candidatus Planktophila sp.]|nr:hypothetical protein [Candidatus Planktophila sp.]